MMLTSSTLDNDHAIWLKGLIGELRAREARLVSQRSAQRYQLNVPVALCARSEAGRVVHLCQAWAEDLSQHGVGLITVRRLNPNDEIFVNFEPASGRPRYLPIRVAQCRRMFGPVFEVGAEFTFTDPASDSSP